MITAGDILKGGYSAKLGSQEWKTFAKQVRRERGNFCELCKRGDVITQVHHWFYEKGKEPWDYGFHEVAVLCKGCHRELHDRLNDFRRYVFSKLTPRAFQILNGALSVALKENDALDVACAIAEMASSPGAIKRMAQAFRISFHPDDIPPPLQP